MEFENVLPSEIEKRSFEIIESELPHDIEKTIKPIVKRVIHTTADFDYLDNLCFSENVVEFVKFYKCGRCISHSKNHVFFKF